MDDIMKRREYRNEYWRRRRLESRAINAYLFAWRGKIESIGIEAFIEEEKDNIIKFVKAYSRAERGKNG